MPVLSVYAARPARSRTARAMENQYSQTKASFKNNDNFSRDEAKNNTSSINRTTENTLVLEANQVAGNKIMWFTVHSDIAGNGLHEVNEHRAATNHPRSNRTPNKKLLYTYAKHHQRNSLTTATETCPAEKTTIFSKLYSIISLVFSLMTWSHLSSPASFPSRGRL